MLGDRPATRLLHDLSPGDPASPPPEICRRAARYRRARQQNVVCVGDACRCTRGFGAAQMHPRRDNLHQKGRPQCYQVAGSIYRFRAA